MRNNRIAMAGGGLILAAPASGSGKTLMTLGLLRLLRQRGLRVAAAKAGPDYIDPTFHAAASGGPCLNLDLWGMRGATVRALVGRLQDGVDIVLCEGVMGLFDGTGPDGETGSTAALSRLTGWPVVIVVDARRQGASAAALLAGFARHDPATAVVGVIFNRVGGARHRALLEAATARHLPELACLGAVPRSASLQLPERHLGLVPAGEHDAEATIAAAAAVMGESIDIARLLGLARPAALPAAGPATPLPPLGSRIAVASDDAFAFAYPAVLQGWRDRGADLRFFSPLADAAPDAAADAIYLPGGYPELHAGRLAAAERFIGGVRRAAAAGTIIYGECGGYMVLGDALTDGAGRVHRMAGLLGLETSFAEPRLHLGYRESVLIAAGPLGAAGARYRGHEFHYATTLRAAADPPLFRLTDSCGHDLGPAGLRRGPVAGSFVHLIDRAADGEG